MIMFYLHKHLASQGITFCALHPGVVGIRILLINTLADPLLRWNKIGRFKAHKTKTLKISLS